jgi:hypothetical protein
MSDKTIVGSRVEFTWKPEELVQGLVLDKISMKGTNPSDLPITGYIIQGDDGTLYNPIAYWRIRRVLESINS